MSLDVSLEMVGAFDLRLKILVVGLVGGEERKKRDVDWGVF